MFLLNCHAFCFQRDKNVVPNKVSLFFRKTKKFKGISSTIYTILSSKNLSLKNNVQLRNVNTKDSLSSSKLHVHLEQGPAQITK